MKTSFLERQMDRQAESYDRALLEVQPLPHPDEFGQVQMSYKDLRELLDARRRLTYSQGFFFGVSCTIGRGK